jgi:fido (protein-threonine AMPylation protein)
VYPWDESDASTSAQIDDNLERLLIQLPQEALEENVEDPLDLARMWHRRTLEGISLEEPDVAGGFRGEGGPTSQLRTCEVVVGHGVIGANLAGVPYADVANELARFVRQLKARLARLEQRIPLRADVGLTMHGEAATLKCAAWAHGEWIRIHPFADGNGRSARIWCNWILLRFGQPPLVGLRPRPEGRRHGSGTLYDAAAIQSMAGSHFLMEVYLREELDAFFV